MKPFKIALLLILIFSMLCACAPAEEEVVEPPKPAWPSAYGEITLNAAPLVISLSDSATRIICEMGYKDQLIGRGSDCSVEEVASLPAVGTVLTPDLAAIRDLVPDLLIVPSALPEETMTFLAQCNIQVLLLPVKTDPAALAEDFIAIGTLLEGAVSGVSYGERISESYMIRLTALQEAARSASSGQTFLFLSDEGYIATGDSYISALLEGLGLQNLAADYTGWSLTLDDCIEAEIIPDLLFCSQETALRYASSGEGDSAEESETTESSDIYADYPPFAEERFVLVEPELLCRQNYFLLRTLDELCRELFPAYNGYSLPVIEPPATEISSSEA